MNKKYANPPIIEVVCELRLLPDSKWDLTIPGLVYEKIQDEFPNKEQRLIQEIELLDTQGNMQQQLRTNERAIFLANDRKTFVQIGTRLLAVNHLKPYTSWSEFKPKIENALESLNEVVTINGLQRIGLRYINKIELPDQQIHLDEFFDFRPNLGEILSKKTMKSFVVGCLIPFSDERDLCKLQLTDIIPDNKQNYAFLLDIDYFLNQPLNISISEIFEWIEKAHQNIEETFEACITDRLREFFKE